MTTISELPVDAPGALAASVRGASHHQVFQRTTAGAAEVRLSGTAPSVPAELQLLSASRAGGPVATAPITETGWSATLEAPVGGPYDLVLAGADGTDHLLAADLLVGDLWVLAGQSNMQGLGRIDGVEPPSPQVHLLDMARRWRLAEEPLHQLSISPDAAHRGADAVEQDAFRAFDAARTHGAGLGLAFATEMVRRTGVPVGLLATAHGGTTLAQWSPLLADHGGDSLFGSMLLSVLAAGGRVAGVLWYQGESDVVPDQPCRFGEDLRALVAGIRAHLGATTRFYHVQLARFVGEEATPAVESRWTLVRELQRSFPDADGVTTAVDLDLGDVIHVSTGGLRRLGRRLALLASGAAQPLQPCAIVESGDGLRLRVVFDNVTGRLHAPGGRATGFSVRDAGEREVPLVFHAAVTPEGDGVDLHLGRALRDGEAVWYGYGLDPRCNLVDGADMAVPAFGPLRPQPSGAHNHQPSEPSPR